MGDLVDREFVLAAFNTGLNNLVVGGKANANRVERYLNGVLDKIKSLPSAQPKRIRGKWIPITNGRFGHECDQCHEYAPSYESGNEYLSRFCPNCGADMRGEQGG